MTPISFNLRLFIDHLNEHGATMDPRAAAVISAAAFRHYFFTPTENHAWLVEYPGQYWREDSMAVENYGVHEALTGHSGWSARRWNRLKGAELVALLRYEQKEGRVVRIQPSATHPYGFIDAFEASRAGLSLTVRYGEHSHTLVHADFSTLDAFTAGLPELVTLRKEQSVIPATRRHALTQDALRWGVTHYDTRKEIIFEVDAFYSTGWRAWEELESFVRSLHTEIVGDRDAARGLAYARAHLLELADARDGAAAFFRDPAAVLEHTGRPALQTDVLDALSAAWHDAAVAIREAAEAVANADDATGALQRGAKADAHAFTLLAAFNG